jgi:hypothetical protein
MGDAIKLKNAVRVLFDRRCMVSEQVLKYYLHSTWRTGMAYKN